MNILQLFNKVPYPPKDGGSVAVFNLSKGFAKAGHKVDLLCLNTNKHFVNISEILKKLPVNIRIYSVNINTDIKVIKALKNIIFSELPYIAERFISRNFEIKLTELLQSNTYDIIQIEGLYMMPYIPVIRKYSNAIISYRAHNIENEIWKLNLKYEKNILKKMYLKHLLKRLSQFELSFLNTYDTLIPITARDGKEFLKLGNKKPMHISPAGTDYKKYNKSEINLSEIKLFHLGSLDWTPNIEGLTWFLKNIWTKLISKYPDLKFTIAGRNASEKLIKTLESYKNIIFKGEIDNAIDFMQNYNIMVVPLLSGSGMRIKIIEGMACGNVIISTPKGAEGINAENQKEILIAKNSEDFSKQIEFLISEKNKIKKISEAAKQFISVNYDNFAISNSLLNFYSEVIKTNN
ncbi:MAG: glycosyltransferase family 4 protein [Chlorobi bacterium]|nr:glycosyltransferase family 4 protein [Chlorobiota bacterium]